MIGSNKGGELHHPLSISSITLLRGYFIAPEVLVPRASCPVTRS